MPQVPIWGCVLIVLAVAALCGALAFFAGVNHRKREAEAAIGSAEDEAKRIISNAIKTAAATRTAVQDAPGISRKLCADVYHHAQHHVCRD